MLSFLAIIIKPSETVPTSRHRQIVEYAYQYQTCFSAVIDILIQLESILCILRIQKLRFQIIVVRLTQLYSKTSRRRRQKIVGRIRNYDPIVNWNETAVAIVRSATLALLQKFVTFNCCAVKFFHSTFLVR